MAPICGMQHLDDTSFEDAVRPASVPVLVQFISGCCQDCGRADHPLADILPWAANRIQCYCVAADAGTATAARYSVTQFPTVLLFRAGRVVRRFVGCPICGELEFNLRIELGAITP